MAQHPEQIVHEICVAMLPGEARIFESGSDPGQGAGGRERRRMGASSLRHIMCFSWFSANNKLSINGNR
jgi:hypothetical protein